MSKVVELSAWLNGSTLEEPAAITPGRAAIRSSTERRNALICPAGTAVPSEAGRDMLQRWVAAKLAYDAARDSHLDPLAKGLPEARAAFLRGGSQ